MIEQAVFTSRQTGTAAGYHLVARSRGVGEDDARALATWCPSHDAWAGTGTTAECFNFHALPSGLWCLSCTMGAGAEYSGRGGEEIYTQCLLMRDEVLARFANQPLALGRALLAQGHLTVLADIPPELRAIELPGRASAFDKQLVADMVRQVGVEALAAAVDAVVRSEQLALIVEDRPHRLVGAILNCLPLAARPACSFTTGLRYSSRRPFRIHCWPAGSDELRQARRLGWPIVAVEPAGSGPALRPRTAWGKLVRECLAEGDYERLAEAASARDAQRTLDDLAADSDEKLPQLPEMAAAAKYLVRDDAPHGRAGRSTAAAVEARTATDAAGDPSRQLAVHCPRALARLEQLDDTLFEAVAGRPAALTELKRLWPEVLAELGSSLVEESKAQYLRHAMAVWRHCNEGDGQGNPARGMAVLEVISLLLGEDPRRLL